MIRWMLFNVYTPIAFLNALSCPSFDLGEVTIVLNTAPFDFTVLDNDTGDQIITSSGTTQLGFRRWSGSYYELYEGYWPFIKKYQRVIYHIYAFRCVIKCTLRLSTAGLGKM